MSSLNPANRLEPSETANDNGGGGLRKPLFKNIHINSEKNRMQILSSGIDRTQEGLPWKNN